MAIRVLRKVTTLLTTYKQVLGHFAFHSSIFRFVCERGHFFEEDAEQEDLEFTCQDGAAEGMEDKRGFWDTPEEKAWPRCLVAPLCPAPPPAPTDGERLHLPRPIPLTPHSTCLLNEDPLELRCPSFLSLHISSVKYGREFAALKELCDGALPPDSQAPVQDCQDPAVESDILADLQDLCLGRSNCSSTVPTLPLGSTCVGLVRELRLEWSCIECRDWVAELAGLADSSCLVAALLLPGWEDQTSLAGLPEADLRSLLVTALARAYSADQHSVPELSIREVAGDKVGLKHAFLLTLQ